MITGRVMRRLLSSLALLARRLADRIETKPRADEPCGCLTCAFREAIAKDAEAVAGLSGPMTDPLRVIAAFATVITEISALPDDRAAADAIIGTAHAVLDAAVIRKRTGVPQMVVFGSSPQAVH